MMGKDNDRPNGAAGSFVASKEGLLGLVGSLEGSPTVALCIETGPRDDANSALDPRRGEVELLSVAARGGVAAVVDVTSVDPGPLLEVLRGKKIVVHDAGFCLGFLKNGFGHEHDGFVLDVQVYDAVLYHADGPREETGNAKRFPDGEVRRRSLASIVEDYSSPAYDEQVRAITSHGRGGPTEPGARGSLDSVRRLLAVWERMARRLQALGLQRVATLEARVAPALASCQNNGFALDVEGWRRQAEAAVAEAEKLRAECDRLAPPLPSGSGRGVWNWGSSNQFGEALELLGAELPRSRGGNLKTGESILAAVSSPEGAARLAQAVLSLRAVSKLASTWGAGWLEPPKKSGAKKFDKGHQFVGGGRVYASFNQVVSTGRMSCSSPNLQNIPPGLRHYFVAPPGRKLLVADFRHLDLVPAAVLAGEERMLAAFRDDVDVHALTARAIAEAASNPGDPPVSDEVVAGFRPLAKYVTFAILYGSNAHGLAKNLRGKFRGVWSAAKAQFLIDTVSGRYPKLERWRREEMSKADDGDDRTHTLIGRRRLLEVERHNGGWRSSRAVRLNAPVQGSAGDGFKYALALTWERRRECLGDPIVVNLVHDEIVVEIGEDHALEGRGWLERCMVDGLAMALGGVSAGVEITISDRWGTG